MIKTLEIVLLSKRGLGVRCLGVVRVLLNALRLVARVLEHRVGQVERQEDIVQRSSLEPPRVVWRVLAGRGVGVRFVKASAVRRSRRRGPVLLLLLGHRRAVDSTSRRHDGLRGRDAKRLSGRQAARSVVQVVAILRSSLTERIADSLEHRHGKIRDALSLLSFDFDQLGIDDHFAEQVLKPVLDQSELVLRSQPEMLFFLLVSPDGPAQL